MSFGSRLEHTVSIVRRTVSGETAFGADVYTYTTLATVRAAIQPASEREVDQTSQTGAGITEHTIFLFPTDVKGSDVILHDQGDCPMSDDLPHMRFEVEGIRNAAGRGHHLELRARAVEGVTDVTGS